MRSMLGAGACLISTWVAGLACTPRGQSDAPSADGAAADGGSVQVDAAAEPTEEGTIGTVVDKELPKPLLGELRLQGDGGDGRLLTLAPGFIATVECSDCGAPTYQWFLAVRCADEHHCDVLTEHCAGEISRELDTYSVELHAVEGEGADEDCTGYSGVFEVPR